MLVRVVGDNEDTTKMNLAIKLYPVNDVHGFEIQLRKVHKGVYREGVHRGGPMLSTSDGTALLKSCEQLNVCLRELIKNYFAKGETKIKPNVLCGM